MQRPAFLNWRGYAALAGLAAAVIACLLVAIHRPRPAALAVSATSQSLGADLAECRHEGERAEADPICRAVWERLRARFLGQERTARP